MHSCGIHHVANGHARMHGSLQLTWVAGNVIWLPDFVAGSLGVITCAWTEVICVMVGYHHVDKDHQLELHIDVAATMTDMQPPAMTGRVQKQSLAVRARSTPGLL